METAIREMIGKYFGKHAKRSWKSITSDFLYVLSGVKNGFLFDYGITDEDKIMCFLKDFTELLGVDTTAGDEGLFVTQVHENIFVINAKITVPFLTNFLEKSNSTCIDVSGKLDSPIICKEDVFLDIKSNIKSSVKILDLKTEAETSQACNENKYKILKLDVTPTCNVSTLFGILIGYPVIYWYNASDIDNCLGMVPLRVYTVKCNVQIEGIFNEEFTMYSFSVPDSLTSRFDGNITKWFSDLESRVEKLDHSWITELKLCSKVVTLPAVAL
ncbi:UPF0739 protein C1orf74 homolog [Antedon mediterranea]|uniref:UPF0739 protein C1orf74 homolog n=1 Tax=Antedon mediterranea TaxID=105859 RepID=UPI003AF6C8F2